MSFSVDILEFAKATGKNIDEVSRNIKLNLFKGVIKDTHVISGRLKGNWQTSTGSPKTGTIARLDKTGSLAIAEAERVVKGDTKDYMVNNLPYAQVREENDGMVATNMARIERNIKEAVSSVS